MKVGDLVKHEHNIGIITKINFRDLPFYKSHTYLVEFANGARQWRQEYEMEVISESR